MTNILLFHEEAGMLYERTTAEELQQFVRVEHDLKKKAWTPTTHKSQQGENSEDVWTR